jgi:alkylation response protein AidB-like acyl-CoA dehydrogenase
LGRVVLNGRKYYTTGTLFADWINIAAQHENGELVGVVASRHAAGVEVLDDWDGFGQALTASGTTIFTDAPVETDHVIPATERFKYSNPFYQLVHLATLAGIGRAAAGDVSRLVKERTRVFSHGNASSAATDPQILQVVGRVRGNSYATGAIVLKSPTRFSAHMKRFCRAMRSAGLQLSQSLKSNSIRRSLLCPI